MKDRLIRGRVKLSHNLVSFHWRIKIGKELLNIAGDLAAHSNVNHRIQCACGGDHLRDGSTGDGNCGKLNCVAIRARIPLPDTESHCCQEDDRNPTLHGIFVRLTRTSWKT